MTVGSSIPLWLPRQCWSLRDCYKMSPPLKRSFSAMISLPDRSGQEDRSRKAGVALCPLRKHEFLRNRRTEEKKCKRWVDFAPVKAINRAFRPLSELTGWKGYFGTSSLS
ncbi:hypothetical protein, variant [Exophiala sideris]|uniref:Uncharacterized protein n=1 Tax=Exophiala sideris TaxID=1016849 RepID=A0A0D1VXA4_9EURO|nr:hypothetical protein, variant [Exophiala sideris]